MQIAQKLKELRIDRALKQSDIATVIGTTQQSKTREKRRYICNKKQNVQT